MRRFLLLSILVGVAGCASSQQASVAPSSKSELSKFDQVQLGLPASQIVKLLGEPTRKFTKEIDPKASYWLFTQMTEFGPQPFITLKLDENATLTGKVIEPTQKALTLAALQKRYGVKDLTLVKQAVGCRKDEPKLGSDVYYSQELGAQIEVSFKGDIQRFVQNKELKKKPLAIQSGAVCLK